jgi:hypothetical protein
MEASGNKPRIFRGQVCVFLINASAILTYYIAIPSRHVYAISDDCKLALLYHTGNNLETFKGLGADKIELWVLNLSQTILYS